MANRTMLLSSLILGFVLAGGLKNPRGFTFAPDGTLVVNGQRLGPVGSTIVAEVLIGLARRSENSILTDPNWTGPTLPSAAPGTFTLTDLLRFAGVLDVTTGVTCQYTVVAGDMLRRIAQRFYGDENQWPRIFEAIRDQVSDPDLIFPEQVLCIP